MRQVTESMLPRDACRVQPRDPVQQLLCWPTTAIMTAKERARSVLDRLPEDCSLDDVLYHLYVAQAVQQGRADADAGRTIPHDEVEAELRRKWLLGGGV